MSKMADGMQSSGLALAGVQFFFTLGWTVYALMLHGLLATAGIAASWLPMLLMVDQLIFAVMDIGFGVAADRIGEGYRRLAKLLLILSTLSAVAFMLLPMAAGLSSGILLSVLAVWVISTSVVRAPRWCCLPNRLEPRNSAVSSFGTSPGWAWPRRSPPFSACG